MMAINFLKKSLLLSGMRLAVDAFQNLVMSLQFKRLLSTKNAYAEENVLVLRL